jgi:hypothetical protein
MMTPTSMTKGTQRTTEALINRVLLQRPIYPIISLAARYFDFGNIAPTGAIQKKEVSTVKKGIILYCFKTSFQIFRKDLSS